MEPDTKETVDASAKRLTFEISQELLEMLKTIQESYRSPSMNHTFKLMIQDTFNAITNKKG